MLPDSALRCRNSLSNSGVSRLLPTVWRAWRVCLSRWWRWVLAPRILLPRAREIAGRVGAAPASWRVYSGRRVLGSCNSRGEVALSCACVFLPPELRDFIVCHELAHLTEMNHSARFHSLCDLYLGGNEKFLIGQLRRFQWPLPPRVRRR